MPTLDRYKKLIDIDPFTVFGLFYKNMRDDNRIKILNAIAELFDLKATIPTSFDSLPVLNPQNATFYYFKGNTVLIIDAKYYKNTTQVQFEHHSLHSDNLYQIFTYVKNREYQFGEIENTVSGMVLYAKTDAIIQPNNVYQMHGNQISVKTLDLNLPFEQIASQLDKILEMHFHEVRKY